MPESCLQCGDALREYICVPHYNEQKQLVSNSLFCTDCWANWQNSRENIDGTNEIGVQCMSCPDCQRPLLPDEAVYAKAEPVLYSVNVRFSDDHPPRTVMVTIDTRVNDVKQSIIWEDEHKTYTQYDTFDLVVDDLILDRVYLHAHQNELILVVPRRSWTLYLELYDGDVLVASWSVQVSPTMTLTDLRNLIQIYTNVPIEYQHLTQCGRVLDGEGSLQTSGLCDGTEVYVHHRYTGLRELFARYLEEVNLEEYGL
jgi:hypothetical protein